MQEMADEVVASLVDCFRYPDQDTAWHGGCLALAEVVPELAPVMAKALQYDLRRGSHRWLPCYPAHSDPHHCHTPCDQSCCHAELVARPDGGEAGRDSRTGVTAVVLSSSSRMLAAEELPSVPSTGALGKKTAPAVSPC